MAFLNEPHSPATGLLHTLGAPFRAVTWFAEALIRAQCATTAYEQLSQLSNEALAAKGLTREDLPAAIYRTYLAD